MKRITNLGLSIFLMILSACSQPETKISVPVGGNAWCVESNNSSKKIITNNGIVNWTNKEEKCRIYFKLPKSGKLHVAINASVESGASQVKCSVAGQEKKIKLSGSKLTDIYVGTFDIAEPGYHFLELEGVSKEGRVFADVKGVLIGGEATVGEVFFVKDEFYWGRRGPSVHINYQVPEGVGDIEYFYNEITVPKGEDVVGSYFMANGFGEGYFGFQVNSESERRILFSVWSGYKTDNPKEIPEDEKILLVKKGEGVTTGEFGNEGSGGQSFWRYNWITGNTYKFLLKGRPVEDGYTQYSAWFKGPEFDDWKLIASFKRPKIQTWLKHQHSFLENFYTETGYKGRKGFYGNQWVCNKEGKWFELTKARFSADATARKEARMDYAGGAEGDQFYMQNCGFFNNNTEIGTIFKRKTIGYKPEINIEQLP